MKRYVIAEKLDQFTPYAVIREYQDQQLAKWQIYKWEQERNGVWPKYKLELIP